MREVGKPFIQAFATSLRNYLTNKTVIPTLHNCLVGVYRCFENLVKKVETGGVRISAASTWIAVTTLTVVFLVLVRRYRQEYSDGTPVGLVPVDSPPIIEVSHSHSEGLPFVVISSVPTTCVDECFEEEFWKSLQEG